ncbi:MAG: hypothetical protein EAY65_04415 [Alphaproteobacteria bacterium]|nr:MAG: hypothetical protein EAY65_04415 [Alphaproteobacteria bacterium]
MMRVLSGGIAHVARVVEEDLFDRETGLRKQHIEGLADVVACALSCRSANTAEWQSVLPRCACDDKSKERFISRLLANKLISHSRVMMGFIPEIAQVASALAMMPEGANILLAGDRFYGTSALIAWCQNQGWNYRLRLKDNLILHHDGGEITTGEAAKAKISMVLNAQLNETNIKTHIGILHESGHKEPWIIAMSDTPSKGRVLDYGMRWGIEPMFSDFKSRGFGITKTQLKHADRITIALFWAASTGMQPSPSRHTKKKRREA